MLLGSDAAARLVSSPAAPALTAEDFSQLMAPFEPFEPMPHLAVAVSGGADSLALCLLAKDWAVARGGRVTALTLDHGLRAESAEEAATVGAWLRAKGITHRVLVWQGEKPRTGIQAAAREARRRLLGEWCRTAGVLHLLLAHHRDDQGETLRLRRERASGPTGLAAMAAVGETEWGRVLRPLLPVAPAQLKAVLLARGQPWLEDPSNRNLAFARARLRAAGRGGGEGAAAAEAYGFGQVRAEQDREVADFLARHGEISEAGFCRLELGPLADAAPALRRRAVEHTLLTVSGGVYPPRGVRLDRLLEALATGAMGRGRTLAGCRLVPKGATLLVVREPAAVEGPVALRPGATLLWDGRFRIRLKASPFLKEAFLKEPFSKEELAASWRIAALGSEGYAQICRNDPAIRRGHDLPRLALETLPALWDLDGVQEVPHLCYGRRAADPDSVNALAVAFRPAHPWGGAGFGVYLPKTGLDEGAAEW